MSIEQLFLSIVILLAAARILGEILRRLKQPLQSEVDKVNQYLLDHHWTISAIHNHWFDESPRLIFLHAQKQDSLNNILNEVRGVLQQTNCGCV